MIRNASTTTLHAARRHGPGSEFSLDAVVSFPRVDIVYAHAGADGVLIDAAVAAGARGLVVAGFAPGLDTPAQLAALNRARDAGVVVVQGSRAGSGRVVPLASSHPRDAVSADNLTPQKARVLLMLALTVTDEVGEIGRMFREY